MTIVVDASTVVALLVDDGPDGTWAGAQVESEDLASPHLLPAEVANMLRRAAVAGQIGQDTAGLAHAELSDLRVALFPYAPFSERVWKLGGNLTAHDAWYVALAEELGTSLVSLDERLARAPEPQCEIRTPRRSD